MLVHELPRHLALAVGKWSFPAAIFRCGGHEGDEEIGECSDDELVGALGVEREIAHQKVMQIIPILLHVVDFTRLHHFLHGSAEVHEGVRGVGGDGDGSAGDGVVLRLVERRRR